MSCRKMHSLRMTLIAIKSEVQARMDKELAQKLDLMRSLAQMELEVKESLWHQTMEKSQPHKEPRKTPRLRRMAMLVLIFPEYHSMETLGFLRTQQVISSPLEI